MKEYDWVQSTLERISDLLRMPGVHNSYGMPKTDPGCAWMALRMMVESGVLSLPVPVVNPTMAGGVAFTWHGLETECAMTINPGSAAGAFNVNVGAKKGTLVQDFSGWCSPVEKHLEWALQQISRELAPAGAQNP